MKSEEELLAALDRWIAAQPQAPGVEEVLASKDRELLAALVLREFRVAAAEAVAQTERAKRVRACAVGAFGGNEQRAEAFLRSPHIALGDRKPLLEAVQSENGAATVITLLEQFSRSSRLQ